MSITAITFFHMGKISSKDVKMMEKMMEKSFLYVFFIFFPSFVQCVSSQFSLFVSILACTLCTAVLGPSTTTHHLQVMVLFV